MDFDKIHRENLVLYSKLFEESPYIPQMDEGFSMGFSSSSHGSTRVLDNLDNFIVEGSSSSNPCSSFYSSFYDPFDPFQVSFDKLNQENYSTLYAPNCTQFALAPNHDYMHVSQKRRLLDLGLGASFQTMDGYQLNETFDHFHQTMISSPKAKPLEEKSCLIFDSNANEKRNDTDTKETVQTRRRRIIDKKSDIIKGQWTPDEDRLLEKLVEKHGVRKWSSIAQMLPGRIGKQCRERWHNHLKPNIKKDQWSEEEDRKLIEAHRQLGNRWAEIARSLPGRSENTIKNHWNATKRRQLSTRKNNSSKMSSNTPLQNYIKNVIISSSDHDFENVSSSSGSISPAANANNINGNGNIAIMDSEKIEISEVPENLQAVATHDSFMDPQIELQFDLQKEMDFMEMLSIGYI